MHRISLPWVIDIINTLDGCDQLRANATILESISFLFPIQTKLEAFFDQSIYGSYLRASREDAKRLHAEVGTMLDTTKDWETTKISEFEVYSLKESKNKLRTVLLAELSVMPTFLVSPKDSYDIAILVDQGLRLFPSALMSKVPETEKDAAEVGRALAFELPTACGFHTFRVMEAVVRRYWDAIADGNSRPKLETLGNFAAEMERLKLGDLKVVESIKQMTKLHRNPLIHPEVILTSEEAIGIIGMARSVISAMLQKLSDAPDTTGAPITQTASEKFP